MRSSLSALAGGIFGSRALARQDEVSQQYRVFTAALDAIEKEYVDDVPSDRLIYSAIDGMLHTLDPHSSFFDPKSYAQMRERQEGRYYGLGITIQAIDGDITVMSIFEGSPAYKKGLRRGDVHRQGRRRSTRRAGRPIRRSRSSRDRRARSSTSASSAAATTG